MSEDALHATPEFPSRHVPLEFKGGSRMAGALELAAPLALGARGLVLAPPRAGASTTLRMIGAALAAIEPPVEVHALLIDQSIEDAMDWRYELPSATVHATTPESSPQEHAGVAEQFERAAARAAEGHDVALLVDSFSTLARAFAALDDREDALAHEGGMTHASLRRVRGLFGLARAGIGPDGRGSLTIVASVQLGTSLQLDELLQHELVGTGNVEWRLSEDALRTGMFPPVDIPASGARRTELIIGEAEADLRAALRSDIDDHGAIAGLGMLLEQLDQEGSLAEVLRRRTELRANE